MSNNSAVAAVLSVPRMSRCARKAVEALQETLPSKPNTIAAYVTGSQARGTATERSDLDIYHLVRGNKYNFAHWDVIRDIVGDIIKVDVMVDSADSIGRAVNVYGSFEYWSMREGVLIYEDGSDDWRAIRNSVAHDIHLPDCAKRWIEFAGWCRDWGDQDLQEGRRSNTSTYIIYRRAVTACIMAALTHDNVRFPHVKWLSDLAGMLRDDSILCGHDLGLVDKWVPSALHDGSVKPTPEEARVAADMVGSIYRATGTYVRVV